MAATTTFARTAHGALAGALGAACMTVVRMTARRRGAIDKMVPQAAEEWLADRAGLGHGAHPTLHHLADQALHVAYGAALGAVYGAVAGRPSRRVVGRGLGFGTAVWILGSWVLMPLLGAKRRAGRQRLAADAVDLLAHAVYGLATAVVAGELTAQPDRGPSSDGRRLRLRVG